MEGIHYLTEEAKKRTRPVWEEMFPEDGVAFLDYYYSAKTKENEILVLEKDRDVLCMLHLNPYQLQIGNRKAACAYVVAVATVPENRHQGMMRSLLMQAMRDRYEKKQPFLFLMPADENIYLPFGFRCVYQQKEKILQSALFRKTGQEYHLKRVDYGEEAEAAEFAACFLKRYADVYALRDAAYYKMLRKESEAEDGTLAWVFKEDHKIGLLSYTCDENVDVREPMLLQEYEQSLDEILQDCFSWKEQPLHVYGIVQEDLEGTGPMIMFRPLYLPAMLEGISAEMYAEYKIRIHDEQIPENDGEFIWKIGPDGGTLEKETFSKRQMPDLELSSGAFAQLLFGWKTLDELCEEAGCHMTDQMKENWQKIHLPGRVFLNEAV